MKAEKRISKDFFIQDVLQVAPSLLGCNLVRVFYDGKIIKSTITEVEAYRGVEDLACHASKGRTKRTEIMFAQGGVLYIYLIYGIHWMLNIVTGEKNNPQALLIRGLDGCDGPGRLTKFLRVDKAFNGEDLSKSERIWVEKSPQKRVNYKTGPRIGISYAGDYWANLPWRYWID